MSTQSPTRRAAPQEVRREDVTLLTVASVKAMKEDYEADERLLAELPARVAQKKMRFEAALLFVSEEQKKAIFAEAPKEDVNDTPDARETLELTIPETPARRFVTTRGGKPTWTGLIMQVLDGAGEGMPHDQIMSEIGRLNAAFGEELGHNTKPYYNAMSKLELKGEIEKRAGYFYRAGLIHELLRHGEELPEEPEEPAVQLKEYSSAWFIDQVLRNAQGGMTAHEIKEALKDEEGVTPKLITNRSFIFNVLKALQAGGYIEKDEETKKYFSSRLGPRGNGAP